MIVGREGIDRAYATGQGRIILRGVASIENDGKGRQTIAITELPYQVNKAELIEAISDLARERKVEGISAMRDESDRVGMRIAIELKRDDRRRESAQVLSTRRPTWRSPSGSTCWAWWTAARTWHRSSDRSPCSSSTASEVITARTQFDLDEASARLHVLEGLSKALDASRSGDRDHPRLARPARPRRTRWSSNWS